MEPQRELIHSLVTLVLAGICGVCANHFMDGRSRLRDLLAIGLFSGIVGFTCFVYFIGSDQRTDVELLWFLGVSSLLGTFAKKAFEITYQRSGAILNALVTKTLQWFGIDDQHIHETHDGLSADESGADHAKPDDAGDSGAIRDSGVRDGGNNSTE